MLKINASMQASVRAYIINRVKGCAFLRVRTNRTDNPVYAFACAVI